MAIQMRRGRFNDFDPTKMTTGEWAVSIDEADNKQWVWMCFRPGVVKRMGTFEDLEKELDPYKEYCAEAATNAKESEDNAKISEDNAKESETNAKASEENAKVSEDNAEEYMNKAKEYRDEAGAIVHVEIATYDKAGLVKPDPNTLEIDEYGTLKVIGGGLLPQLLITSDLGATIKVTNGILEAEVSIISGTTWSCEIPSFGVWQVTATLGGKSTTVDVAIDTVKVYNVTVSQFSAYITVGVPNGGIVTVSNGTETYTSDESPHTFTVHSKGLWTVTCVNDNAEKKSTVNIISNEQEESLIFTFATIEITVADDLVGKIINLSKGSTIYSKVAKLITKFSIADHGEWVASIEGNSASVNVTEDTTYQLEISSYNYKTWLERAGVTTQYASIDEALADQVAMRRAMTIHASADYLLEWYENDNSMIDTFIASDTAMKWIGYRDYVCDKLLAIASVKAKMLASDNWARILKDHVPVMTSNSAPYGTAFVSSYYGSGYEAYKPFSQDARTIWSSATTSAQHHIGYTFASPTIIKKLQFKSAWSTHSGSNYYHWGNYELQASNDGFSTYDVLYTETKMTTNQDYGEQFIEFENDKAYMSYRIKLIGNTTFSPTHEAQISSLQFYGRSLNVSSNSVGTLPPQTEPKVTISGVTYWTDKTEREFAEGSTMKYLYDHGVELESLIELNGGNSVITKRANDILINQKPAGIGGVVTQSAIDLTSFKLFRCVIGDIFRLGGSTSAFYLRVKNTNTVANTTVVASADILAKHMPNNSYLDISSVNSELYPAFYESNSGYSSDATITEMWLE